MLLYLTHAPTTKPHARELTVHRERGFDHTLAPIFPRSTVEAPLLPPTPPLRVRSRTLRIAARPYTSWCWYQPTASHIRTPSSAKALSPICEPNIQNRRLQTHHHRGTSPNSPRLQSPDMVPQIHWETSSLAPGHSSPGKCTHTSRVDACP